MNEKCFLVAGLGNIGPEYALTRHNIGFMTLDAWSEASNVAFTTDRYGDVATIRHKGREFVLLKPSTYMNLSGNAVRYWLQRLDLPLSRLIVVCDDLNLPFGTVRMRQSGSDGGHNGLKNIEAMVESRDYARIRMGVGHEFEQGGQIDFVLGQFSQEQLDRIPELAKQVRSGILTWAFVGAQKAMTELNTKKKEETK